jgi:hypothetical protein
MPKNGTSAPPAEVVVTPAKGGGHVARKGVDSRLRGNDGVGSTLSMQMTPLPGAPRGNSGNPGSSTALCAASRNTTKRSNTLS